MSIMLLDALIPGFDRDPFDTGRSTRAELLDELEAGRLERNAPSASSRAAGCVGQGGVPEHV
jgi:hypothetical protein